MKHTYKQKIEILNGILKEYAKHFIYFDDCKCYEDDFKTLTYRRSSDLLEHVNNETNIKHKPYKHDYIYFYINFESNDGEKFPFLTRRPFTKDIDKIIARYRSKLSYELEKYNLKLKVNDAILELEFKNKLKSIMI